MKTRTIHLPSRSRLTLISIGFIFLSCTLLALSSLFKKHTDTLSTALILDLTITAPLVCYLLNRKSATSVSAVIKVFMLGMLLAGLLISAKDNSLLHFLKTWVSPLLEVILVLFLIQKFRIARRESIDAVRSGSDFYTYSRNYLIFFFGNKKAGAVIASELAVLYYTFFSRSKKATNLEIVFTSYKESGIRMILGLILGLMLIETCSMHFLFLIWNKTFAIVLTTISFYTCLQLFAHIRAIKQRPSLLIGDRLILRNGIWGGEASIDLDRIEKLEYSGRTLKGPGIAKLSFLKKMDNHNLIIHLKQPVIVTGAFGIEKHASVILVYIDNVKHFASVIPLTQSQFVPIYKN
ncbi:MAG: hypothetical protein ACHQRM_09750 [Bacteroidia bacterium]